ncbi:MAG: hypothetical protein F7B06_05350 [Opitutae bacterium]|nr:hypothetical protein [Opitutae bacterium]
MPRILTIVDHTVQPVGTIFDWTMKANVLSIVIAVFLVVFLTACQCAPNERATPDPSAPLVIGYGESVFSIGEILYSSQFEDPQNWTLQIQTSDSSTIESAAFVNGILDLYMPDRGCTAWLNRAFEGPIAVVYDVYCPEETLKDKGIHARDINNFWHATHPSLSGNLFDSSLYTGKFTSYHKMHGYYASTGGGHDIGNKNTRFRRYPREKDNAPVSHIALNHRDGNPDYLITPGKWHTVQLVAFNGLAQYIVDGKVVYEIKPGDQVSIENGNQPAIEKEYTLNEFPPHTKGHIGLRMVRTHHRYANFKVYRLTPLEVTK